MLQLDQASEKYNSMRYGLYEINGDVVEALAFSVDEAAIFRLLHQWKKEFPASQWLLVDLEKKVVLEGPAVEYEGVIYPEEKKEAKAPKPRKTSTRVKK